MGSAGAKAMAVIRGEADIYLHTGGQYEWDSCAPAAVAAAHGLHVSRVDGSPLVYNQAGRLHARSADLPEGTCPPGA
jgi:3'(2'), 5'-bisphosphate nucleotidase